MELSEFWAKTLPFQSVVTHGIISGSVCRYLMTEYLSVGIRSMVAETFGVSEEELTDLAAYITSLHDIGKIEYYFQSGREETRRKLREIGADRMYVGKDAVRHEKTGATAIRKLWKTQGQKIGARNLFSGVIGAHHQKNYGRGALIEAPFFAKFQMEFEEEMRRHFMRGEAIRLPDKPSDRCGVAEAILLGLMILSDWIASGTMFSDGEEWISDPNCQEKIAERVKRFLNDSGLRVDNLHWNGDFMEIWPRIPRNGMRALQRCGEELIKGEVRHRLILIEAPMGEGKTEAGMYCGVQMLHKWEKDGFYVALPTAATSNQMVARLREWFSCLQIPDKIRLLHAMAWIVDETMVEQVAHTEDQDEIIRWLAPLRRGLLGQFSVGTIDQAMLSVTKTKYGVLRLLGLSKKVLVIDEIHSYDVYMGEFIQLLLQWCRAMDVPVVMLSATLPPNLKAKLLRPYTDQKLSAAYPLITAVREDGTVDEIPILETAKKMTVGVELLPILDDPERIAQQATELVGEGGCLCVLMNTVGQAQRVYSALEKCFDGDLLLFHAQFPAFRRQEIEEECIRKFGKDKSLRPQRAILVATQVVEQSLDVDFDSMMTAIAPIDLVLQRMGRIFRHEDTPRPTQMHSPRQFVMVPKGEDFGADAYVYPEVLLRQTVRVLSNHSQIRIPEDLATMVAEGYDQESVPSEGRLQWMEHIIGEQVKAEQSKMFLIGAPSKSYSATDDSVLLYEDDGDSRYLSVQTRLGEPSVRIALLEPELWDKVEAQVGTDRIANVRDKDFAKEILGRSVSVAERRLCFAQDEEICIKGANLLSGLRIYPSKEGCCALSRGKISLNNKLGMIIEEVE